MHIIDVRSADFGALADLRPLHFWNRTSRDQRCVSFEAGAVIRANCGHCILPKMHSHSVGPPLKWVWSCRSSKWPKWGHIEPSAFYRFRCRKQLLRWGAHVPSRAEQQRLMMRFAFGSGPDDLEATAR